MERGWSYVQCHAQLEASLLWWPRTESQRAILVSPITPLNPTSSSITGTRQGVLWRVPSPPLHLQFCSGVRTPQAPQDWVESLYETPARPWNLRAKTSDSIGVTAGAVRCLAPPPTHLLHLCPTITYLAFCQGTGSPQREYPDLTVGRKTLCLCPPPQAVKVRFHVQWALQAPLYPSNLLSSFCLDRHLGNQVWTPGRWNYT